jgi:hypothetical protein
MGNIFCFRMFPIIRTYMTKQLIIRMNGFGGNFWHNVFRPEQTLFMIKKHVFVVLVVAVCTGMVACGGEGDNGSSTYDSSAGSVQSIDSARNTAPQAGMGDSTMRTDSNRTTSTANDSVKRIGGGATSSGDTTGRH